MTSILVIDDDEALCRAVAETLTKAGYETRMFHDGQEALRRFDDDPTDIVLTDVFMPNLDGLEVDRHASPDFAVHLPRLLGLV